MASEKFLKLKDYSDDELANELKETEQAYHKLQFDQSLKGLDNPLILRETRRDIARMKTEIRSRELAGMSVEDIANRSKLRYRRKKK